MPSNTSPQRSPFSDIAGTGEPDIANVARLIKSGDAKNIIVMAGAGISTSAGIPDFRTPGTGLYANLSKYNLPTPEAVFSIDYFHENPSAFFTLSKELCPGKYLPTPTHVFFTLLHKKGLLRRVFTQNIDTLERMAGLPAEKIVEAHGSFATSRCTKCSRPVDPEWMLGRLREGEIVRCKEDKCKKRTGGKGGLVKPDIVFFGEGLPSRFFELLPDFARADLLLVLGTSLQVQPFASLTSRVPPSCPRALINLERVGELASFGQVGSMFSRFNEDGFDFDGATRGGKQHARDVFYEGKCDDAVWELVKACGWEEEFSDLLSQTQAQVKRDWAASEGSTSVEGRHPGPASDTAARASENVGKSVKATLAALPDELPHGRNVKLQQPDTSVNEDSLIDKVGKLEIADKAPDADPSGSGKL